MHYLLLTSITIILWSSLALLVAKLNHLPPFFLLAVTLLIGGSLSVFRYKKWSLSPTLLLVGVCGIFGYHFLLFMALRLAPPLSANLLNYLWPLLILLFTPIFFPEFKITKRHIVGATIAFIGAALIINQSGDVESIQFSFGYLFAIGAAVTWALYSLMSKKMAGFSSATVGLFCLLSGLLALMAHFTLEQTPNLAIDDFGILLLLGFGPMGISFYCWDDALKRGDPRIIATMSYFTPLLSTFFLIAFTEQTFTLTIFLAMLCITCGAVLASIPFKKKLAKMR